MKGYYEVQDELRSIISVNAERMRRSTDDIDETFFDCFFLVEYYLRNEEINETVADFLGEWIAAQHFRYIRDFERINKKGGDD